MFTQAGFKNPGHFSDIWARVALFDRNHRFKGGWARLISWRSGDLGWLLYGDNERFLKWGNQLAIQQPLRHVWIGVSTPYWRRPQSRLDERPSEPDAQPELFS